MMSKNLRLLLVPLLVLAQSHVIRSQEEEQETEVVETETPQGEETQEASSETDGEAAQTEEPAEQTEQQSDEPQEEPAQTEEQPMEESGQDATETTEEAETPQEQETTEVVEETGTVQDEPAGSIQWQEEKTSDESSQKADDTTTPEAEPKTYGEDEVMGIDTVDIPNPQGNWLYKRVWWERAEAKFERIRETVGKIMEVRTGFFAKRAELDKNVLDPFYIQIGMSQGELQEVLKGLVAKADRLIESESSDSILEKLEEEKRTLQNVKKQVEAVTKQDQEVENAILMLVEQVTKVRNLEQQAWQDFKAIARVLDDRKARELFYKVDAAWRNIKELQNYIEQTFATSFDALIEKAKKEVERVKQEMNALKDTGTQLQQGILGVEREQQEMEEEEEPEPKGFFTRYITDPITSVFKGVWSVISWPYRAIFGTATADEDIDEDEMAEEPAVQSSDESEGESVEEQDESEPETDETEDSEKE